MGGLKRLLTAAAALPLLVAFVYKAPEPWFIGALAAITGLGLYEFLSMYGVIRPLRLIGALLGAAMIPAIHALGGMTEVFAAAVILVTVARLFHPKGPEGALADTAPVVLGLGYVGLLMGYQVLLRAWGPQWILLLYGTVWAGDSVAYYLGTTVGRRKLCPSISPNKTVAGAVGSLLGGGAGAAALVALMGMSIEPSVAVGAGTFIGAVTIVSDLVESMYKRDAGVKDSGTLVPGHGGILDKLDGSLFSGPALYLIFTLLGR